MKSRPSPTHGVKFQSSGARNTRTRASTFFESLLGSHARFHCPGNYYLCSSSADRDVLGPEEKSRSACCGWRFAVLKPLSLVVALDRDQRYRKPQIGRVDLLRCRFRSQRIFHLIVRNDLWQLIRVTVALLMGFSILVTSKQYIGDPIDCISSDSVPTKILDSFCWIHSTFSVKQAWHKEVGREVPYPGVDNYTPGEGRVYHAYYQWVCFVLFFQAALFYLPRYLWKAAEGRKISSLVMGLSDPVKDDASRKASISILCRYFRENRGYHKAYVFYFFSCELMNLVNVVGQIFLVNEFLGGEFWTYGLKVFHFIGWDPAVRFDPMIQVFPRLTKCNFHMYGSSGDVQKYDTMCILPINIINEKIYFFMWFWFLILACVSTFMVVYRLVIIFFKPARFHVLAARARLAETRDLYYICSMCDIGDWFLLSLLSKNLDSVAYRIFARQLCEEFGGSVKDSEPFDETIV